MTPEQVLAKMIALFGEDNLVNPEHQPKVFKHQVNLAKWLIELETKSTPPVEEQKP